MGCDEFRTINIVANLRKCRPDITKNRALFKRRKTTDILYNNGLRLESRPNSKEVAEKIVPGIAVVTCAKNTETLARRTTNKQIKLAFTNICDVSNICPRQFSDIPPMKRNVGKIPAVRSFAGLIDIRSEKHFEA